MINRLLTIKNNRSFFLFGPRQTGKTTYINHQIEGKKALAINLFLSSEYAKFLTNPQSFEHELDYAILQQQVTTIFIDEIQRIPELLNIVHVFIEKYKNVHFIISGSSARKLKREGANMLAGRALSYKMHPFSYEEIQSRSPALNDILAFGLIPPVFLSPNKEDKIEMLRSYINTFIHEEIEVEARIRRLDSFFRFLQVAGHENGNILNFSKIGKDVGTNYNTVKDYFQILEDCLIGFFLYPFVRSKRKRISKHPKFYFFDTGVVRAITKRLTVTLTPLDPDYGHLFEHFVILEIMKLADNNRLDLDLSYFRTEKGMEIDLVIETPDRQLIACEIKSTSSPTSEHLNALRYFQKDHPNSKCYLISNIVRPQQIDGINIIPWQQISAMFIPLASN